MRVTIVGFLSDQIGHVLLQQTGEQVLTPISSSLEIGVSPHKTLANAFQQATGLYVMPVRLVGLYLTGGNDLTLTFRCTLRGGELQPATGQPPAGFFAPSPSPRGLSATHRRQLEDALRHAGGPALAVELGGSLWGGLRRPKSNQAADAPDWAVTARLVVNGGHGQVGWTRGGAAEPWRLPAAVVGPGEAPWATAEGLRHSLGLDRNGRRAVPRLITLAADRPALSVVCVAELYDAPVPRGLFETIGFAAPNQVDDGFDAADRALAAELLAAPDMTLVRLEM